MTFYITAKGWRLIGALTLLILTGAIVIWVSPIALIAIAPELWFITKLW